ncbi:MAG: hypothetical protein WC679_01470 [Bacteroidales bacterium]|jgi:hypothetical protein
MINVGDVVQLFKLSLGARFSYVGDERIWVLLERTGCGIMAEYSNQLGHLGQQVCSIDDSPEELRLLEVVYKG